MTRRSIGFGAGLILILCVGSISALAQESSAPVAASSPVFESMFKFSPKLFGRTSTGIVSNVGTVKGSGFTMGGGNIGFLYFISQQIAVGAGYKVESDSKSIPLRGFDIYGRYYFLGAGTVVRSHNSNGDIAERQRTWNPYGGIEFSSREFYSELDEAAQEATGEDSVTGSVSALNASLGLDYRISRHWEATIEGNMTLLSFSGSDPRVKVRWMLLNLGVNYVF